MLGIRKPLPVVEDARRGDCDDTVLECTKKPLLLRPLIGAILFFAPDAGHWIMIGRRHASKNPGRVTHLGDTVMKIGPILYGNLGTVDFRHDLLLRQPL